MCPLDHPATSVHSDQPWGKTMLQFSYELISVNALDGWIHIYGRPALFLLVNWAMEYWEMIINVTRLVAIFTSTHVI